MRNVRTSLSKKMTIPLRPWLGYASRVTKLEGETFDACWLVNPLERTLEALKLDAARWVILGVWRDDARVRAEPFDAIELELELLWADVKLE